MPDFDERTEQATPQKRQKAKEKGQVPRSRELSSIFVSFVIFFALTFYGSKIIFDLKGVMRDVFNNLEKRDITSLLNNTFFDMAFLLFPILIIAMFIAFVVSVSQGGFFIKTIELEFDKLNPVNGLKKIFSSNNLVELLKSLLKFIVGGVIFYIVVKKVVSEVPLLMKLDLNTLINQSFYYLSKTTKYILFAFFILAVMDYGLQYWLFEKSLRMTKQEIRDEYKEQEGDPLVKSRIRSLQREIAQRRMMQDVAKATVVITNPTHLAVALKYSKELQAPKVVAKGAELIAQKIKEIARKNNVPIIEDKPLARALYKLDIGEYIPKELYRAVAKIIAFVYKNNNRTI
jgi:flagellar biosynthetic protein FlhB